MNTKLQPLHTWPQSDAKSIRGVLTDIDGTLTYDGRVPASVFDAMEKLQTAGLLVIPITGRPAGWCDMIARSWPVDGVVGENGALYFSRDTESNTMRRVFIDSDEVRAENRRKLDTIRDEILASIPGAGISSDQPYRVADLAIDFCEDVKPLSQDEIDTIASIFHKHGATAKVSSIHVNGWFGEYDKLSMTKRMMRELYDMDLALDKNNYAFVGDSPNDCPMFEYFPNAIGVANLLSMQDQCSALPTWITTKPEGEGFVEVAEKILSSIK
ncbi:MAG: HAD-IIB family hydrolase [Rhodospirillales bacterium]|jgi:HAD superfamily hydrolase (TIGR01484 family)|nr:HAD-IIB family hydrolase [Rhodospirillales bacterium]